jgi:hypothetical protein
MLPLYERFGISVVLIVCGIIAFIGFAATFFLVEETMGKPLQEEEFETI